MSTTVKNGPYQDLVTLHQPDSPTAAALRQIAIQLRRQLIETGSGSIAVVGDRPGHGASLLAANLSIIFANGGSRTILVDCNFAAARQHVLFGIPHNATGISDLLLGEEGRDNLQLSTSLSPVPGLTVIPIGTVLEPVLLSKVYLSQVMGALVRAADVVIYDVGAAPASAEIMSIISNVTTTVIACRKHSSRASDLSELEEYINAFGGRIGGVVVFEF